MAIQYNFYENSKGGYALHGITLTRSPNRFSAWFSPSGNMTDCQSRHQSGKITPVGKRQKEQLQTIGRRYLELYKSDMKALKARRQALTAHAGG